MAFKIYQSSFKIFTNTKYTHKILPTTSKICQNSEISPNLVTLAYSSLCRLEQNVFKMFKPSLN